jgi:hypothetical protein
MEISIENPDYKTEKTRESLAVSRFNNIKVACVISHNRMKELKYAEYRILHFEAFLNFSRYNRVITSSVDINNCIICKRS